MQIKYTHNIAIDLGGSLGHTAQGRVLDVPQLVAYQLIRAGHAEEVREDPVEPVRVAEPPKRRTR